MCEKTVAEKIVDYVEQHLEEELSLDKIAKELNFSKFYIARSFSKKTGETIYRYIKERRLTLAAQKLVETKKPIIEIAYEAQYNSQQAFTLAFNQLYLCTPQVYRKNGIYYPKRTRFTMRSSLVYFSHVSYMWGGKIAA